RLVTARQSNPEGLVPLLNSLRAGDGETDWAAVTRLVSSLVLDRETTRLTLITGNPERAGPLAAALPHLVVEARTTAGAGGRNAGLRADLRAVDANAGKWRAEGSVTFSPGFAGAT